MPYEALSAQYMPGAMPQGESHLCRGPGAHHIYRCAGNRSIYTVKQWKRNGEIVKNDDEAYLSENIYLEALTEFTCGGHVHQSVNMFDVVRNSEYRCKHFNNGALPSRDGHPRFTGRSD